MGDKTLVAEFCPHSGEELALIFELRRDLALLLAGIYESLERHRDLDRTDDETDCRSGKFCDELGDVRALADDGEQAGIDRAFDIEFEGFAGTDLLLRPYVADSCDKLPGDLELGEEIAVISGGCGTLRIHYGLPLLSGFKILPELLGYERHHRMYHLYELLEEAESRIECRPIDGFAECGLDKFEIP